MVSDPSRQSGKETLNFRVETLGRRAGVRPERRLTLRREYTEETLQQIPGEPDTSLERS